MKVMCIKEMESTDKVFTSIKIGDWLEVGEKSIYAKTNEDPSASSYYYFINGGEYAFYKDNFITLQQWREQQLNKLI